jgi:PleD family two-component response regulator
MFRSSAAGELTMGFMTASSATVDREASPPEARLLVVDDEATIVELLSASLRFAGFEVASARNGHEAI